MAARDVTLSALERGGSETGRRGGVSDAAERLGDDGVKGGWPQTGWRCAVMELAIVRCCVGCESLEVIRWARA